MNVKTLIILCVIVNGCSQQVYYNLEEIRSNDKYEINAYGIDLAKEVLLNDCRKDKHRLRYWDGTLSKPRKQYGNYDVDNLDFVSIPLFEVTKKQEDYSSNVTQYLKWNNKDLLGFYTFKEDEFEGLLDWSGFHHDDIKTECYYFTIHNDAMVSSNPIWLGYQYLKNQKRKLDCLFGVKYFRSTLWFVENQEVFVLDLEEMKVYNPDEFIRLKCDKGFIDSIANGSRVRCNH